MSRQTGQQQDTIGYWETLLSCEKREELTEGMAVAVAVAVAVTVAVAVALAGGSAHRVKTMWLWWKNWHSAKKAGHKPTVWCIIHPILVWSVWRDNMNKNWMKSSAMRSLCQICGCRTAVTSIQLIARIWAIIQQSVYRLPYRSGGCEWF